MRQRVKTGRRILTVLASACLLACFAPESVQVAEKEYTYTVNIYAGDQGTFTDAVKLNVDHRKSGNTNKSQVKIAKGMITVSYQDAAGNELAPSDTYYGSVGDKPVVAYRYVEGYEPDVAALTKTLKANEAENVFTFVYAPVSTEVVTRQVGTPGTVTSTVTELVPGAPTAVQTAATTETTETTGTEDEEAAPEEAAADEEAAEPLEEIGDQEVPLANQDLKDLDEEEVPASDIQLDKVVKKGFP